MKENTLTQSGEKKMKNKEKEIDDTFICVEDRVPKYEIIPLIVWDGYREQDGIYAPFCGFMIDYGGGYYPPEHTISYWKPKPKTTH